MPATILLAQNKWPHRNMRCQGRCVANHWHFSTFREFPQCNRIAAYSYQDRKIKTYLCQLHLGQLLINKELTKTKLPKLKVI